MYSRDAVLFANEAFYQAFAGTDLAAMDALWAQEMPVTCIHPGWHVLNDRDQIMAAWEHVFSSDKQAPLICRAPEAFVVGEVAFVICPVVVRPAKAAARIKPSMCCSVASSAAQLASRNSLPDTRRVPA